MLVYQNRRVKTKVQRAREVPVKLILATSVQYYRHFFLLNFKLQNAIMENIFNVSSHIFCVAVYCFKIPLISCTDLLITHAV